MQSESMISLTVQYRNQLQIQSQTQIQIQIQVQTKELKPSDWRWRQIWRLLGDTSAFAVAFKVFFL